MTDYARRFGADILPYLDDKWHRLDEIGDLCCDGVKPGARLLLLREVGLIDLKPDEDGYLLRAGAMMRKL